MKIIISFLMLFVFLTLKVFAITENENFIVENRDGKSPKTAFKVYSIADEYEILALLNLKPTKQTFSIINGLYYDIFEANGKNVYFILMKKKSINKIEI
ncbi:MAG: hypothetical protein EAZ27_08445 [Cytophagales bacterium]|nr:MAG: hypothetical protein EAZ27_08445 [Cytophagales bacterium]